MLLKFAVTNFKSFKHQQVLDLTAGIGDEFADSLYEIDEHLKVNSTACVIGPNGCGKTHLLSAIDSLADAIESVEGVKQAHRPYCLAAKSLQLPTEYELLIFDQKTQQYLNYRVAVRDGIVEHESLHVKSNSKGAKTTNVFERNGEQLTFAKKYQKYQTLLEDTIGESGLIANYAKGVNLGALNTIYSWSKTVMLFYSSTFHDSAERIAHAMYKDIDNNFAGDKEKAKQAVLTDITDMANTLGFNIDSIDAIVDEIGMVKLLFKIAMSNGSNFSLNYIEAKEYFSEGTFNTINLLFTLHVFLNTKPCTVLIDEFDGSLHHKLSEALLAFIRKIKKKSSGSQVIMTTHDVLLLDKGFRRDSIFVLDKDEEQSTVITRADEFSVRKDAKLSLKYLNNEFGALPKILTDVE